MNRNRYGLQCRNVGPAALRASLYHHWAQVTQAGQEELFLGVLPSCLSWTSPAQLLVEALDIVGQVGTLQPGLMNQHEGCSVLWYGWKTRVELALKVS